jgi:hypothetical protein
VDEALAQHPFSEPGVAQHPGGAELEDTGPNPLHDVLSRLTLEDDALDAPEVEQMREQQTRRSTADYHHLCVDPGILAEAGCGRAIPLTWAGIRSGECE